MRDCSYKQNSPLLRSNSLQNTGRMSIVTKCPICNREKTPSLPFIEGICIECYLAKKPIEPVRLKIKRCKVCGAVFLKGRWEPDASERVEALAAKEAEKALKKRFGSYGFEAVVNWRGDKFKAQLFGNEGSYSMPIEVIIEEEKTICPTCLYRRSGSYEAKIQIRSNSGAVDKRTFDEVMKIISSFSYDVRSSVVSIDELKEGFDINLMDKASAKIIASAIADKLGGEVKTTYKLISEKGGEKRTRLSISLRLYSKKGGELVELNGEPALVVRRSGEPAKVILLPSRREIKLSKIEPNALKPFSGEAHEATLQAVLPDKVIVLLEDFSTEEVPISSVFGGTDMGKYLLVESENGRFLIKREMVL
jgi:nonsense-mediated mRNA decay protein 3